MQYGGAHERKGPEDYIGEQWVDDTTTTSHASSGVALDVPQPFRPARNASLDPTKAYDPRWSDMTYSEGHQRKSYGIYPTYPPHALIQQDSFDDGQASPLTNPQADSHLSTSWYP
jgi:hypothetical protein